MTAWELSLVSGERIATVLRSARRQIVRAMSRLAEATVLPGKAQPLNASLLASCSAIHESSWRVSSLVSLSNLLVAYCSESSGNVASSPMSEINDFWIISSLEFSFVT